MRGKRRIVVFIVLAVLVVVVRFAHRGGEQTAPAAAAAPSPTATTATVSPTVSPSPSPSPSASPSAQAPVRAAQTWVAAWLDTRGGQRPWLARLRPLTDGTLWDNLALPGVVDSVPHGTVQSGARVVEVDQGSTVVRVPATAGAMLVVMTPRGKGWVAIANDRAPR